MFQIIISFPTLSGTEISIYCILLWNLIETLDIFAVDSSKKN